MSAQESTLLGLFGTVVTAAAPLLAALAPWQENISWVLSICVGCTTIVVLVCKNKKL